MRQSLDFARRPAPAVNAANGAAPFDPRQLPALTAWINWAGATDTGTLSVPDLMGGSPATQGTGALKPTVGTADNGIRIGTFSAHFLSLPLSAAINNSTKFGIAFWLKVADVSGIKVVISVNNFAGGANANRMLVNTFGASFEVRAQNVDRHAQLGSLDAGVWRFCYAGIDCSQGTEATQVIMSLDGAPGTVTFNSDTAWPASLPTPTGNMIIGGNSLVPSSPLVGSIGDLYFFLDQLSTADQVRLMQFNRPL